MSLRGCSVLEAGTGTLARETASDLSSQSRLEVKKYTSYTAFQVTPRMVCLVAAIKVGT
jgi:hypothetical protein